MEEKKTKPDYSTPIWDSRRSIGYCHFNKDWSVRCNRARNRPYTSMGWNVAICRGYVLNDQLFLEDWIQKFCETKEEARRVFDAACEIIPRIVEAQRKGKLEL